MVLIGTTNSQLFRRLVRFNKTLSRMAVYTTNRFINLHAFVNSEVLMQLKVPFLREDRVVTPNWKTENH